MKLRSIHVKEARSLIENAIGKVLKYNMDLTLNIVDINDIDVYGDWHFIIFIDRDNKINFIYKNKDLYLHGIDDKYLANSFIHPGISPMSANRLRIAEFLREV